MNDEKIDNSIFQLLAEAEKNGSECALCTIVDSRGSTPRRPGSKMLVYPDGSFLGTVGGGEVEQRVIDEALASISHRKPRLLHYRMVDPQKGDPGVCGGELDIYIEPILPKPTVLIIGGGHVGRAVAHLASWLDYRVVVSDDRPEFCTHEANPDADEFLAVDPSNITENIDVNEHFYLVLTTRGVDVDVAGLPGLIRSNPAYIGVIGSRRRWAITRDKLLEKGFTESQLENIRSPMGLDIKAETPGEIALSIMSEITLVRQSQNEEIMKKKRQNVA